MARFLRLCMMLAEVLILIAEIEASMNSKQLKAVEGAKRWKISSVQVPVASPAPSEVSAVSETPRIRQTGKHHHFADNSVAGGDVILGGFITVFIVAVVWYIRVTRKNQKSPARV
ncbi:Basic helix-loop-helix DNA-binding superfamily protein [Melia azedarach]|uniref:Basic helix-loop-helix DNA-binding superfamily protein n=1 Tax=Melia azedarach TaxID=155640 RepID=A0ACC1WZB8_MELAZ|nr:Basic helix-loop-helix DNA-binding superfamily protein [Melia azedarach]